MPLTDAEEDEVQRLLATNAALVEDGPRLSEPGNSLPQVLTCNPSQ